MQKIIANIPLNFQTVGGKPSTFLITGQKAGFKTLRKNKISLNYMSELLKIAHVKPGSIETQSLEDHLQGTAELAKEFAGVFKNSKWGECLGLLHDLGKLSDDFQHYIRVNSGYSENDIEDERTGFIKGRVDHTSAGAIYAKEKFPIFWLPLSYCIAGHHAGLLNWLPEIGISGDLSGRLSKSDIYAKIINNIPEFRISQNDFEIPCGNKIQPEHMHLWIRMLFSCLVDADFLDTERFMQPEVYAKRGNYDSISELKERFYRYMKTLMESSADTPVNRIRKEIFEKCISKGCNEPGFFSVTVPTGGGKTLSAMAWALEHAVKYNKRRIIVAIPYTSITAQNAKIYRDIFGGNNVIEHHSNIDDAVDTQERKLASENWDAPVIVTTNVQLFESLLAKKTSRCRKLHNIADSIIVLDEAQMLPPEFLRPILSVLKGLVSDFGVSVLLSTATQPVLTGEIGTGNNAFTGIESNSVRELIEDYNALAIDLKRVKIHMPADMNVTSAMQEIAGELTNYEQCLCIVNTRKECRELYKNMPEDTLHLSRMMCTSHIMKTIEEIKQKLKNGESVRVVSTQLIEAGVDVDFPVVYRAFAGLDSIAQSAGRCNREGKLNLEGKLGITKVFIPEKPVPPGLMRYGADTLKELLYLNNEGDYLSPEMFSKYFNSFYSRVPNFDKADIKNTLIRDALEMKFQFATAARNFRLIDDNGTKSILVAYDEGAELIEIFKQKGPEPWLMRRLQQYSVSVNRNDFDEIIRMQRVEQIHGCYVQADAWLYNSKVGITLGDEWSEEILMS